MSGRECGGSMERDGVATAAACGGEAAAGAAGDGRRGADRHARNVQLLRDLDALRDENPAGYAEAIALLDELEQRVRDRKK
jgi:hypothetical protein